MNTSTILSTFVMPRAVMPHPRGAAVAMAGHARAAKSRAPLRAPRLLSHAPRKPYFLRGAFGASTSLGGFGSQLNVAPRRVAARGVARPVVGMAGAGDLSPASKRVDSAAKGFRKLGVCSFWSQLVLTTVSSVIIVFAILYRTATKMNTEAGLYLTLFGLLMGFLSTFWAFGYTRLAAKLRAGVESPELTPPRAEVLKSLTSGITINLVGLAATLLGLEATCGLLFAKSLAFAASNPYANVAPQQSVQALDIFVVQASANTLLSHFLALCFSLWLLRMITQAPSDNGGEAATA